MKRIFTGLILAFMVILTPMLYAQADLQISKLMISPEEPVPGEELVVSVTIINKTEYSFPSVIKVSCLVDDKTVEEKELPEFAARGVKNIEFKLKPERGKHQIKIIVDPGAEPETDPLNNIEETEIIVIEKEAREEFIKLQEIKDLPDLICLQLIKPTKALLVPDNEVVFFALFRNLGDKKIDGPFHASWSINDKLAARAVVSNFPPKVNWKFGLQWKTKKGKFDIKAVIDDEDVIREKDDKNNNTCLATVSVHPKMEMQVPRRPNDSIRGFAYDSIDSSEIGGAIVVEKVDVQPVMLQGEQVEGLWEITYHVKNITDTDIHQIGVTVFADDLYIHSYYIDELRAGASNTFSFIDKVSETELEFTFSYENRMENSKGKLSEIIRE